LATTCKAGNDQFRQQAAVFLEQLEVLADGVPFERLDLKDAKFWEYWSTRMSMNKTVRHGLSHGGAVWLDQSSVTSLIKTAGLTSHMISAEALRTAVLQPEGRQHDQELCVRKSVDLGNHVYATYL
jgi:hypothetical protein